MHINVARRQFYRGKSYTLHKSCGWVERLGKDRENMRGNPSRSWKEDRRTTHQKRKWWWRKRRNRSLPNVSESHRVGSEEITDDIPVTWKSIADEQREDDDIAPLFKEALSEEELGKVLSGYFVRGKILMRKWKPSHMATLEDWSTVH